MSGCQKTGKFRLADVGTEDFPLLEKTESMNTVVEEDGEWMDPVEHRFAKSPLASQLKPVSILSRSIQKSHIHTHLSKANNHKCKSSKSVSFTLPPIDETAATLVNSTEDYEEQPESVSQKTFGNAEVSSVYQKDKTHLPNSHKVDEHRGSNENKCAVSMKILETLTVPTNNPKNNSKSFPFKTIQPIPHNINRELTISVASTQADTDEESNEWDPRWLVETAT